MPARSRLMTAAAATSRIQSRVMRYRALIVIGLLVVGGLAWWFVRSRARSERSSTPSHATASRDGLRNLGDRGGPAAPFVVDDDVRGTLRLEGQVVDAHDEPVGGATVVLSLQPAAHRDDRGRRRLRIRRAGRPAVHADRAREARRRRAGEREAHVEERARGPPSATCREGHGRGRRSERRADRRCDRRASAASITRRRRASTVSRCSHRWFPAGTRSSPSHRVTHAR